MAKLAQELAEEHRQAATELEELGADEPSAEKLRQRAVEIDDEDLAAAFLLRLRWREMSEEQLQRSAEELRRRAVEIGIDENLAAGFLLRLQADDQPLPSGPLSAERAKPDWNRWNNIPRMQLWQAIALSCGLEPEAENVAARADDKSLPTLTLSSHLSRDWGLFDKRTERLLWEDEQRRIRTVLDMFPQIREFRRRLEIAEENVGLKLPATNPPGRELARPGELLVLMTKFSKWVETTNWVLPDEFPRATRGKLVSVPANWPWGAHDTRLLQHLAAAAREKWASYDPEKPATAPTNEEVSEWLEKRGVAKRVAEVMAQILRADGLKAGPHVNT